MAKRIVKCPACGGTLDINKEEHVIVNNRRYGHPDCYLFFEIMQPLSEKTETTEKDDELKELKDYIAEKYKDKANWSIIGRQIKEYTGKNKYTCMEIKMALQYIFEIKKMSINNSHGGIGLVPYVIDEALNYYKSIEEYKETMENIEIEQKETKVFTIKEPQPKRKKNRFLDWEVEVEDV